MAEIHSGLILVLTNTLFNINGAHLMIVLGPPPTLAQAGDICQAIRQLSTPLRRYSIIGVDPVFVDLSFINVCNLLAIYRHVSPSLLHLITYL